MKVEQDRKYLVNTERMKPLKGRFQPKVEEARPGMQSNKAERKSSGQTYFRASA